MPTAEIIAIGTELLLGEIPDTNTRFIARMLRSLGIDLFRTQTVGDNADRISQIIHEAAPRTDVILTTGGLGPTVDDPTRQAIAAATNVDLEFHPELWEEITTRIAGYGRTPTENQKRQAYLPKGAIAIHNPVGTAPAFIQNFHITKTKIVPIISLPGVPKEMEYLVNESVVPFLKSHFQLKDIIQVRNLHVSGIGEGMIDELIGDLEYLPNPTIGLAAHSGIVDIRISAKGSSLDETNQMISKIEEDLRSRLGKSIYGVDEDTLEGATMKAIEDRGWTLTCLESNMSGALLNRFSKNRGKSWLGGDSREIRSRDLPAETNNILREKNASIALGIKLTHYKDRHNILIFIISPSGRKVKKLSYGGHPQSAPRWAANMGLTILYHIARDSA